MALPTPDASYNPETDMLLELDIELDDPTAFTMEHWLYLSRTYPEFPEPAYELAPFPMALRTDKVLRDQLTEWGYITPNGPTDEIVELLTGLSRAPIKMWGQVRFPQQRHERILDLPTEAKGWGLEKSTTVTPRIPFLIARHDDVILAATSHPDALTIAAYQASASTAADLAYALGQITDPESLWSPAAMSTVMAPRGFVDSVASLSELSYGSPELTERERRQLIHDAADGFDYTDSAQSMLVDLLARPTRAIAQALVTVNDGSGDTTDKKTCVSLVFTDTDDEHKTPEKVVAYPTRRRGREYICYASATDTAVQQAIERAVNRTVGRS